MPVRRNFILNAPMLDFINPTFKIDQVVLPDLSIDMNYMNVPRVDRCMTCHRAIDRPGFESKKEAARLAQELQHEARHVPDPAGEARRDRRAHRAAQAHPGRAERHPQSVAHASEARALRRLGVAASAARVRLHGLPSRPGSRHRIRPRRPHARQPEDGASLGRRRRLGLLPGTVGLREAPLGLRRERVHRDADVSAPVLRGGLHQVPLRARSQVDGGDEITKATQTVELYGCYACHKISNWRFTDLRKPGPDLNGIAEKTTPEWAFRWISEPHNFRSTTRMPSFFYQRNMIGPASFRPHERAQNIKYPGRRDPRDRQRISSTNRRIACGSSPAHGDAGARQADRRQRRLHGLPRRHRAGQGREDRRRCASRSATTSRSSATTASTSPASARRRIPPGSTTGSRIRRTTTPTRRCRRCA